MSRKVATLHAPAERDVDTFVLPHTIEGERATLGAAILSTAAADYLCDQLTAPAFFRRVHQTIFLAIFALREAQTAIDLVTLKDALDRAGKLEEIGGPVYLVGLTDAVESSAHFADYCRILKDLHIKRALVAHSNRTINLVAEASHSAPEILRDADRRLMELQAGHAEGRMISLRASSPALQADLSWRVDHQGELTGVDTGFKSINDLTLGWQAGDLVIIGARPSVGKTTFVLNSAVEAARGTTRTGRPRRIALFSLEMRRTQLEYRLLSQLSGVPLSRLLGGHLTEADYARVSGAIGTMSELAIEIDDRSGQSVYDVRAACRRMKADGDLDLAIVDYIQLMPGTLERKSANRNEEITDISRRLKDLADEVAAPVIALSQLTRGSEDRPDPRPKLRDLRESGALEQDADIVAFLHRKNHREGGITNFILEKQRNGPTGTVNLHFDRDIILFTDAGETPVAAEPVEAPGPRRLASPGRVAKRPSS